MQDHSRTIETEYFLIKYEFFTKETQWDKTCFIG